MSDTITLKKKGAEIILMPDIGAALVSRAKASGDIKTSKPPFREPEFKDGEVASWGEDNDFPQQLMKLVPKSTILSSVLPKKANLLIGHGVRPFTIENYDNDGREVLKPYLNDAEVNEFIRNSNLKRTMLELAVDFNYFMNFFPETVLRNDKKKITQLAHQEAMHCRWEVMDEETRYSKFCHVSSYWPEKKEDFTDTYPVINPYDPNRYIALAEGSKYNYIYPISYPTPGQTYYQLAPWYSAVESEWYEVARMIPIWKKAVMNNQASLKFIIYVDDEYWPREFPGYNGMKPEDQLAKRKEKFREFMEFVSGPEAAGRALMTSKRTDPILEGKTWYGWEIKPVTEQVKDGIYIEDSQEATAHLLRALDLDPTLVGFSAGKDKSSPGSGSDKRVAFNIYIETIRTHRDILTEPLDFISRFNGWPENLVWRFVDPQINTLGEGKAVSNEIPTS